MLYILMSVLCIGSIPLAVIGWRWIREDNQINDISLPEWDDEYNERLNDDSQDSLSELIRPHHLRADFLDIWEANWNREAIRIRFDTLRFHIEVLAEAAMWQLEIEKGVNISATT